MNIINGIKIENNIINMNIKVYILSLKSFIECILKDVLKLLIVLMLTQ
jgi:hypothetical protein